MRKSCLMFLFATILMVGIAFAGDTPRENTFATGKTGLTNVAAVGLNTALVPGYIELCNADPISGEIFRYYLYVTTNGELYIASSVQVGTTGAAGKPQETLWMDSAGHYLGTIVGGQS